MSESFPDNVDITPHPNGVLSFDIDDHTPVSGEGSRLGGRVMEGGEVIVHDNVEPVKEDCYSFKILTSRPAYISPPDPLPNISDPDFEIWINIGVVNGVLPSNRLDPFLVDEDDIYVGLKVDLSQSNKNIEVTGVTIEVSDDPEVDFENAAWADQELSQTLPAYIYVFLGHIHRESGTITNYGRGSVNLSVVISGLQAQALTTRFTREIVERRLG